MKDGDDTGQNDSGRGDGTTEQGDQRPPVRGALGVEPPAATVREARAFVDPRGLVRAARELDVSREVLLRVIAGLTVRRGSLLAMEAGLAKSRRRTA